MLNRIASDRRLLVLTSLIFWLLITVISATQFYVRLQGQYDGGWLNFFWRQAIAWAGWAILTPFIFYSIREVNHQQNRFRLISIHIGLGLGFTAAYSLILGILSPLFFESQASTWDYIRQSIITSTAANLLVYMLISVFSLMIVYYQRSRQDREDRYKLDLEVKSLEKQLVSAQLETLKSQIQPHFLFNSMHSIASLIRKKELDKATETIAILSDLLRATLKNQEQNLISLEEEMSLITKYLEIEKIRFGDNLNIDYKLDSDTSELLVPAFILQPLVENCFKHAFRNKESGKLIIESKISESNLELSVTDDGEGLQENSQSSGSSIGIQNVRRRLTSLYEQSASVFLSENDSGGTTAQLLIPILP